MTATSDSRPRRDRARPVAAVLLAACTAVLLSELVTLGTASLLVAAAGLLVLAAALVLSLPLLERLPAARPRPEVPARAAGPRPVGQPLVR